MIYEHRSPHCDERLEIFDQKWHDPHVLPFLFTGYYLSNCVLFPQMKVLKGKHFADVEEVKQKTAEALKGIRMF